jgi:hypothetical protein
VGTNSRVLFLANPDSVQLYGLWHGFQSRTVVGQFCVVSGFLLAGNVLLLLICTFLKLNNKSLSLIGFPHIGVFPGIA